MNTVEWNYFNKFEGISDRYMPPVGEGETKASQLVTAVNKLVYKWYNDGDVFDNTYFLDGWCNDLSSYANWIHKHYPESQLILEKISTAYTDSDYEMLLKELADKFLDEAFLQNESKESKVGSIYNCEDVFKFEEY